MTPKARAAGVATCRNATWRSHRARGPASTCPEAIVRDEPRPWLRCHGHLYPSMSTEGQRGRPGAANCRSITAPAPGVDLLEAITRDEQRAWLRYRGHL